MQWRPERKLDLRALGPFDRDRWEEYLCPFLGRWYSCPVPMASTSIRRVLIRFLLVLLVVGGFAYLTHRLNGSFHQGIDDADITLVYATHLAHGDGFVFNQGGERVEGFTSLLWVLICAAAVSVVSSPELAIRVLCTTLVAAAHTVVTLWLDQRTNRDPTGPRSGMTLQSILYLGLVCASPAYVTWMTITLMDTCLWSALVTVTLVWLVSKPAPDEGRSNRVFCSLVALLLMARPESFVLCPVVIAIDWARMLLAGTSPRTAARATVGSWSTYVLTGIALTAFRYLYFGYPLPNTYYAKVAPSLAYNLKTGLPYLGSFLASTPVVAVSALVLTLRFLDQLARFQAGRGIRESIRSCTAQFLAPATSITVLCAVMLVIPLSTGGDHFVWWRFYQPVYPLLVLGVVCALSGSEASPAARSISGMHPSVNLKRVAVFTVIVFAFLLTKPTDSWLGLWTGTSRLRPEFELASGGREIGRRFAGTFEALQALPSVGVVVAGGLKHEYPGEVIDLMGLNSVAMGHSLGERKGVKNHAAFNRAVFYQLLPDIVEPGVESIATGAPIAPPRTDWSMSEALHNISSDPEFQSLYRFGAVHTKATSFDSIWITGYFRKAFLQELARIGAYNIRLAEGP